MKKPAAYRILTVTGTDRPGIIASVTGSLFRLGCNLEDISMTLLGGQFSMMLVVCIPGFRKAARFESEFRKIKTLRFFWTDIKPRAFKNNLLAEKQKYVVTVLGKDHTGIVHKISRVLADQNVNIVDLQSKIIGRGKKRLYSLLMEIEKPKKLSLNQLKNALNKIARLIHVDIAVNSAESVSL